MKPVNRKTPFKNLTTVLQEIRERPLSNDQIKRINLILENDKLDRVDQSKKVAKKNVESCQ